MIPYEKAVRIDRIPVQQARMVRVTAAAAATTTFRKYHINLTLFLPPLLLFIYFITATAKDPWNKNESNQIDTAVRYNNSNSNSDSNSDSNDATNKRDETTAVAATANATKQQQKQQRTNDGYDIDKLDGKW